MTENEQKQLAFETLIDKGLFAVIFQPLYDGVFIPKGVLEKHAGGSGLILFLYSKTLCGNLKVNKQGIHAILTFEGQHMDTFVPWGAIVAMQLDGQIVECWPEEDPSDFMVDPDLSKWTSRTLAEG